MTAFEIFYYTGTIFFILFTVISIVVLYYVVKTMTMLRTAMSNINSIVEGIKNNAGKLQLGTLTLLFGLIKVIDPNLKEFTNIELECGLSKVKILKPDWIK